MTVIHDAHVRQQALDPAHSFLVQAPAGSGKTELLIRRFLNLLSGVNQPEHILALTFTRKAAGEMRTRILRALERATLDQPPASDHERTTWELAQAALRRDAERQWRLLDNPHRLKIQTIDSFCATLVQQTPLLSNFGSILDIQERAESLYQQAARKLLEKIEEESPLGEAARTVLKRLDNSKSAFLKRMVHLLQKRDRWMLPFFSKEQAEDASSSRQEQENFLNDLIVPFLRKAHELFSEETQNHLLPLLRYAGGNIDPESGKNEIAVLKELIRFPDPDMEHLRHWKGLAVLLTTQGGQFRKARGINKNLGFASDSNEEKKKKAAFINHLQALEENKSLENVLGRIQLLPDSKFSEEEWDFLQSMLFLLQGMEQILRSVFMEKRKTDFSEVHLSALRGLGKEDDPTDLLLKYDFKLQHILVDEFQDTSFKQVQLLEKLTSGWQPDDGRTLFIVGDPMQSIYRFRDAEVYLFTRAAAEQRIGQIPLTPLQLSCNFRSQKEIVDWVNDCFKTLNQTGNEVDRDLQGAISYPDQGSVAVLDRTVQPGVRYHPIGVGKDFAEARQIIQIIEDIQEKEPDASIAILIRTRNHLSKIVPALRNAGIRIRAEEIDRITERPDVLDLMALLKALLSPMDRIAWLSILRAPWCGLLLQDIHRLCAGDVDTPVWDLLQDGTRLKTLSADGQKRLQRIRDKLSPALLALPSENLRDILEGCWIDLGGPSYLPSHALQDTQVFFDEVERLVKEGQFEQLHHFERILESLYANPSAGEQGAVQIMTMHKAKGLEFDYVLLPGLGKGGGKNERQLIHWLTHKDNVLFAPIGETGEEDSPVYQFLSHLDRDRDYFEMRRLLYVAATRAKTQLHLFAHPEIRENGIIPRPNTMLDHLWPFVDKEWEEALSQDSPDRDGIDAIPAPRSLLRRLPAAFPAPAAPPPIETGKALDIREEREDRPPYYWARNTAKCLGIVLHRCFKEIADEGLQHWNESRVEKLKPALKAALLNEGLSFEDAESAVSTGMTALKKALEDDRYGKWVLGRHQDDQSEYALTLSKAGVYANKIIDRTFVDDNGVRWIIDYKTGQHEGADLEHFFKSEADRYRPQLEGYADILKEQGETRPIKMALYYPLHQQLIEIPAQ